MKKEEIEMQVRAGKTPGDPAEKTLVQQVLALAMRACRAFEPSSRPSFSQVHQKLSELAEHLNLSFP